MAARERKAKMGRPPKPPGEKWAARVTVRMPPAEFKKLKAEAKAAGKSVASYLLDCWKEKDRG